MMGHFQVDSSSPWIPNQVSEQKMASTYVLDPVLISQPIIWVVECSSLLVASVTVLCPLLGIFQKVSFFSLFRLKP